MILTLLPFRSRLLHFVLVRTIRASASATVCAVYGTSGNINYLSIRLKNTPDERDFVVDYNLHPFTFALSRDLLQDWEYKISLHRQAIVLNPVFSFSGSYLFMRSLRFP